MGDYDLRLIGTVGGWDFDSDYVDYMLGKKKDCQVNVLIDSLGGLTNTGLSISSAFRNHGNVNVTFRGMNASAATIAALGAAHVAMEEDALYLIHKCSIEVFEWAYMNEEQIEQKIQELEHERENNKKIDLVVATAYAKKTKRTCEEMLDLMSKELWLTANEALEYGFIDEVIDSEKKEPQMVITSSMEKELSKAGIPIPTMLKHEEENFFNKLAKFFKGKDMENVTSQTPEAPKNEELQKSVDELNVKVTSLEETNKKLSDENEQLKKTVDELKTKAVEEPKQVLNNGHQPEKTEDSDFLSTLSAARELSKLV